MTTKALFETEPLEEGLKSVLRRLDNEGGNHQHEREHTPRRDAIRDYDMHARSL